jgi:hypothetical protein
MKRNKYRNTRVTFDGIKFDSMKERNRYIGLKILLDAGLIEDLKLQPRYKLYVNGALICTYVGDFSYIEKGKFILEDVKSEITRKNPIYRIKKKLVKACYNIDIFET